MVGKFSKKAVINLLEDRERLLSQAMFNQHSTRERDIVYGQLTESRILLKTIKEKQ